MRRITIKRDPPMKRVGRGRYDCVCGQPLNEITVKNLDPWCSTACCHEFHGIEIPANPTKRGATVASSS
jgi:hypothetical protein